jgi:hypothetical protein
MITARQIINECNTTLDEGEGSEIAKKVGKAVAKGAWIATKAIAKGTYRASKWALGIINWEKADAMKMAQYAMKKKDNDTKSAIGYLKRVLSNQEDPKIEREITKAIEILRRSEEEDDISAKASTFRKAHATA